MKFSILFLTIMFSFAVNLSCLAQDVEIIERSVYSPELNVTRFDLIDDKFDLADHMMVARIKGITDHSKKNNLLSLFRKIWTISNSIRANAFKFESIETLNETTTIILKIYRFNKEELIDNKKLYPGNMIYVFGDLELHKPKEKTLILNDEKIRIAPLHFVSHQNSSGKDATLSIGGFLGSKAWIRGEEGRPAVFFSFTGFGLGEGAGPGQVGFNTGRFHPVDLNLGMFLINTLKEQKA